MIDSSIFKAYDVRGIWQEDVDADGFRAIGRAFAQHLEPKSVAVGRDMRTMAPEAATALIEGLTSEGVDVIDLGMVGTEMTYFAVASMQLDGGIQVTASHNPKEYIGAKTVRREATPVGGDTGLMDIGRIAAEIDAGGGNDAPGGGQVTTHDIWPAFVDRVASFVDVDTIKPLTVVFDAANGMGGRMFNPLIEQLPIDAHMYYDEPDGTFPNHQPNPLLPENREFILSKVREHNADLGVAWDGDADRVFFVDDTGEFVSGDFVTALLAKFLLRGTSDEKVLYDLRASRAVPDTIEAAGAEAVPSRVGHAFIKQRMRADNALFAGEVSGHYYFRDFFKVDTGMVPVLIMLQLVSEAGGKLSTLLDEYRSTYFISGEINSTVEDVPMKFQQLKEQYRDGRITHLDGISVEFDDWHFNVRSSNTEPLLRLNLEATTHEMMETRRDEVLDLIRSSTTARL